MYLESSDNTQKDQGLKLIQKGCDRNNLVSCLILGKFYLTDSENQDKSKAHKFLEKACSLHEGNACNLLGEENLKGNEGNPNHKGALKYFEASCNEESLPGCQNLKKLYKEGLGVKKDLKKVKEIDDKICDFDFHEGCDSNN